MNKSLFSSSNLGNPILIYKAKEALSIEEGRSFQWPSSHFNLQNGVPILFNTNFDENESIVNAPEHALTCYQRTSMDMLVLGNCEAKR